MQTWKQLLDEYVGLAQNAGLENYASLQEWLNMLLQIQKSASG